MNFLKIFKYFNSNSKESKELKKITDTLATNDKIAQEMLIDINNTKTKVVLDEDITNSYYVYLQDTIYISNKEKNQGIHRCCLVAHECIHSKQSKIIQTINFVISNIELIAFIVSIIVILFNKSPVTLYIYLILCILSVFPRTYLELDAIFNSLRLSKKYLEKKLSKVNLDKLMDLYRTQIYTLLPFSFISLFFGKIVRILVVFIITFFI